MTEQNCGNRGEQINHQLNSGTLAAKIEPFDTFAEGPVDIDKGYSSFGRFYRHNYLKYVPASKTSRIIVVSCGPGYFVNLLHAEGYGNVFGIDSDPEKVRRAQMKKLRCEMARAFEFLQTDSGKYDLIFCEQELNHLTKEEMVAFLRLCKSRLNPGGSIMVHSINGANPITGSEALAQNFDHFNTLTEYSLRQILTYTGFEDVKVIPLNLYVFYANPLNYPAWAVHVLFAFFFRLMFKLYGKSNKLFTKKIAAVARAG